MGDQSYKQSISLADMELLNIFSGLNHEDNLMGFCHDHSNIFLINQDQTIPPPFFVSEENDHKRKAMDIVETTPTSSAYSSPQVSDNGRTKMTNVSLLFFLSNFLLVKFRVRPVRFHYFSLYVSLFIPFSPSLTHGPKNMMVREYFLVFHVLYIHPME